MGASHQIFATAPGLARRCLAVVAVLLAPLAAKANPDDLWLQELAAQLTRHFAPEGELVLEWARPRPAAVEETDAVEIVAYPVALAPQLLLRARAGGAEHTLVLRAQLWRDGFASRTPATRGEAVELSAMELVRFDALRDRDALALNGQELDLIFLRSVPAGRLLTWRDVVHRPLVRRGQLIEVAASDGALTVTLRGIALADASRGEIVRVRNPDSRKEFTAQVIAEARAQVRF